MVVTINETMAKISELHEKKWFLVTEQDYEGAAIVKKEESELIEVFESLHDEYLSIISDSLKKEIKGEFEKEN